MRFLLLLFLFPTFAFATTLHLSDILKKGFHFSSVRYAAFDEPESARGKDTEEYLAAILKNALDNIDNNYVLIRNLTPEASIENGSFSVGATVQADVKENSLNFPELKRCAGRSLSLIKASLFHKGLRQDDLLAQTDSLLSIERGIENGYQVGVTCGLYMGVHGEMGRGDLIEEYKLMSFLSKESDESIQKLFKIIKHLNNSRSVVGIRFFKYLKTAFLVYSFKGQLADFRLLNVKQRFIKQYLSDSVENIGEGVILEVNNSQSRAELENLVKRIENEIM